MNFTGFGSFFAGKTQERKKNPAFILPLLLCYCHHSLYKESWQLFLRLTPLVLEKNLPLNVHCCHLISQKMYDKLFF
jgi:hypothetical protein